MEADKIEESSVRLLGSSSSGGSSQSRWVDGSEVYWEPPPWSKHYENEGTEAYGSIRRRLVKKPKRVDSFDVEAMEIAGGPGDHSKVNLLSTYSFFPSTGSAFWGCLFVLHLLLSSLVKCFTILTQRI